MTLCGRLQCYSLKATVNFETEVALGRVTESFITVFTIYQNLQALQVQHRTVVLWRPCAGEKFWENRHDVL